MRLGQECAIALIEAIDAFTTTSDSMWAFQLEGAFKYPDFEMAECVTRGDFNHDTTTYQKIHGGFNPAYLMSRMIAHLFCPTVTDEGYKLVDRLRGVTFEGTNGLLDMRSATKSIRSELARVNPMDKEQVWGEIGAVIISQVEQAQCLDPGVGGRGPWRVVSDSILAVAPRTAPYGADEKGVLKMVADLTRAAAAATLRTCAIAAVTTRIKARRAALPCVDSVRIFTQSPPSVTEFRIAGDLRESDRTGASTDSNVMPPQSTTEFRIAGDLRESDHMSASTDSNAMSLASVTEFRIAGEFHDPDYMGTSTNSDVMLPQLATSSASQATSASPTTWMRRPARARCHWRRSSTFAPPAASASPTAWVRRQARTR